VITRGLVKLGLLKGKVGSLIKTEAYLQFSAIARALARPRRA
jgi:hypothetical protein